MNSSEFKISKTIDADGNLTIAILENHFDKLFEVASADCDFLMAIIVELQRQISDNAHFEATDPQYGIMFRVQDKKQLLSLMKTVNFRNFKILSD